MRILDRTHPLPLELCCPLLARPGISGALVWDSFYHCLDNLGLQQGLTCMQISSGHQFILPAGPYEEHLSRYPGQLWASCGFTRKMVYKVMSAHPRPH